MGSQASAQGVDEFGQTGNVTGRGRAVDDPLGGGAVDNGYRCGESLSGGDGILGGCCFPDPLDKGLEGRFNMGITLIFFLILMNLSADMRL